MALLENGTYERLFLLGDQEWQSTVGSAPGHEHRFYCVCCHGNHYGNQYWSASFHSADMSSANLFRIGTKKVWANSSIDSEISSHRLSTVPCFLSGNQKKQCTLCGGGTLGKIACDWADVLSFWPWLQTEFFENWWFHSMCMQRHL